jgi:hypothetical protein
MDTKLFAVLDDTTEGGIKIVRLQQRFAGGYYFHTLNPYVPFHEPQELTLSTAQDKGPGLVEFSLSSRTINVWRTGWTVNHKNSWIQVLDSDERDAFPGNFAFLCNGPSNYALNEQLNRRLDIMNALYGYLPPAPPASAPPATAPATNQIPRFVAEIMKKEAIAKNDTCPISFESFAGTPVSITSCFHLFDTSSINKWLDRDNSCPLCKAPVSFVQAI